MSSDCYSAELAVCPFFHSNHSRDIVCEGPLGGSSITVRFRNSADRVSWRARYCNTFGYARCRYCAGADAKYTGPV